MRKKMLFNLVIKYWKSGLQIIVFLVNFGLKYQKFLLNLGGEKLLVLQLVFKLKQN